MNENFPHRLKYLLNIHGQNHASCIEGHHFSLCSLVDGAGVDLAPVSAKLNLVTEKTELGGNMDGVDSDITIFRSSTFLNRSGLSLWSEALRDGRMTYLFPLSSTISLCKAVNWRRFL